MLTEQENDKLTRVGPGTPMGALMRKYWLPALLSSELERDGAPVRLKMLGERLIAFRDSSDRVGLLEEFCAHRRASLFLGRNENCGLRCVYHGWKYDVTGQCVDLPTEAPGSTYKSEIRLTAYPTIELGGVVWAYLGIGTPPAPPKFEWTQLAPKRLQVSRSWVECNWLQALEGGIDSAHASWLHSVISDDTKRPGLRGLWTKSPVRRDEVVLTSYGHCYAALRAVDDRRVWAKVYHYVAPVSTFFPFELPDGEHHQPQINGNHYLPMDDENTMIFCWIARYDGHPLTDQEKAALEEFNGRGPTEIGPDFRKRRNADVNWKIDRRVQKEETFSGIDGINNQDQAVQESMGPIVDRSKEHLSNTDVAVIATRRVLLRSVKNSDDLPPGILPTYYKVRATEQLIEVGSRWTDMMNHFLEPADLRALSESGLTTKDMTERSMEGIADGKKSF
jgi:phenylpropionate dioxygenase-like ring-hydroxylating dioxygenase large terminal subunit